MRLCAPLYVWVGDDTEWARAITTLQRGDIAVITGPASGPPTTADDITALGRRTAVLHAKGVTVAGYTHLTYGHRPTADVTADVHAWQRCGVDGVWFDETPAEDQPGLLAALRGLHGYVRSWRPHEATGRLKGITCWNPGTWHPDINAKMRALPASLWCTIECAHTDYPAAAAARRSSWPPREIHLVHSCPSVAEAHNTEALIARNAGYGYATPDGVDGNPWDSFRP